MASSLQTLTTTMVLMISLFLGFAEQVSGMRYIPNSYETTEIKDSDFLVNIVPQPSVLVPDLGWFLFPPKSKKQFHLYKDPVAAAPITSYGIPSRFAPNPGYEALSPSSREDQVPPVPQP